MTASNQRLTNKIVDLMEENKRLREAIRPLVEGLYNVYKADGYWLRVSHPQAQALVKVFEETGHEQAG